MEYSVWKSLPHSPERGDTCSIQHLHQLASTTRSVQHMALPVFTPAAPKWLGGRAPYVARRSGYFFPFFFPLRFPLGTPAPFVLARVVEVVAAAPAPSTPLDAVWYGPRWCVGGNSGDGGEPAPASRSWNAPPWDPMDM